MQLRLHETDKAASCSDPAATDTDYRHVHRPTDYLPAHEPRYIVLKLIMLTELKQELSKRLAEREAQGLGRLAEREAPGLGRLPEREAPGLGRLAEREAPGLRRTIEKWRAAVDDAPVVDTAQAGSACELDVDILGSATGPLRRASVVTMIAYPKLSTFLSPISSSSGMLFRLSRPDVPVDVGDSGGEFDAISECAPNEPRSEWFDFEEEPEEPGASSQDEEDRGEDTQRRDAKNGSVYVGDTAHEGSPDVPSLGLDEQSSYCDTPLDDLPPLPAASSACGYDHGLSYAGDDIPSKNLELGAACAVQESPMGSGYLWLQRPGKGGAGLGSRGVHV